MKKTAIFLIFLLMLTYLIGCTSLGANDRYLRIHVRANSDSSADQEIKLVCRDALVTYLTPLLKNLETVSDAEKTVRSKKSDIESLINEVLFRSGFSYKCELTIDYERFPERTYEELTLPEGVYRAVILNLGSGEGQNWWCVAFPPLCFGGADDYDKVKYSSIIYEAIQRRRGK